MEVILLNLVTFDITWVNIDSKPTVSQPSIASAKLYVKGSSSTFHFQRKS